MNIPFDADAVPDTSLATWCRTGTVISEPAAVGWSIRRQYLAQVLSDDVTFAALLDLLGRRPLTPAALAVCRQAFPVALVVARKGTTKTSDEYDDETQARWAILAAVSTIVLLSVDDDTSVHYKPVDVVSAALRRVQGTSIDPTTSAIVSALVDGTEASGESAGGMCDSILSMAIPHTITPAARARFDTFGVRDD